jgi:predicted Zn-dependent peptidase
MPQYSHPDRSIQPISGKVLDFPLITNKLTPPLTLLNPEKVLLDNGIPLYLIKASAHAVIRLDLVYNNGKWFEDKPLVSSFYNQMLREGTLKMNSAAIAEFFDYYGAYPNFVAENDNTNVQLYCQSKHFKQLFPVLWQLVTEPLFPEHELETFRMVQKQDFMVNLEKVAFLARGKFNALVYGKDHPYGVEINPAHYDAITRDDLVKFHHASNPGTPAFLILSGCYTTEDINMLNRFCGRQSSPDVKAEISNQIDASTNRKSHFQKDHALQTAIRIGKVAVSRTDADYAAIHLLTTVLGGYFGSRLMRNIRENKGYTYGINAWVIPYIHAGNLVIASETNAENAQRAIDEIYREMDILTQQRIDIDELELVKNYITGSFLRSIDGPFGLADRTKTAVESGLNEHFYIHFLNKINQLTPDELLDTAKKYYQPDSFYEVTAGL